MIFKSSSAETQAPASMPMVSVIFPQKTPVPAPVPQKVLNEGICILLYYWYCDICSWFKDVWRRLSQALAI